MNNIHHHLIISSRCQNNCRFCATGALNHTLAPDDVIDFLNINKGDSVLVTGGEPTLHPNFIEIAKYIKEQGGYVEILTNSIKFADKTFCDKASEYIDSAQCSFYSWSPVITNYLTGNKKAYMKTTQGIHNLIDSSVEIDIKTLVNLRPCYRTLDMTINKIINEFSIDRVWMSGCDFVGNLQINHGLIMPLKLCVQYINDAIDVAISAGVEMKLMYLPLCVMSNRNATLVTSPQGNNPIDSYMSDDCTEDSGNYDRAYGYECDNCSLKYKCTGVWSKYLNLYNGGKI